ncbi:MAG: hypothetical protein UT02_C0014G0002 [Parcubacteria group bacterium GW2011_GWC2_38_7]|nr:MAG: hypothetical protein UT02_C0014G0002 [Parcubacteria group bacterium GW2011_GWC2_38_7]
MLIAKIVQNVLSLRLPAVHLKGTLYGAWFKLFVFTFVLVIVVSGCTKYEPVKTSSNVEGQQSVLEVPADLDSWPAERKVLYETANQTGIPFSATLPQKMEWRFDQNGTIELMTIDGYLMVAEATNKSSTLVNQYLESQSFVQDDNNLADGIMGGQVGYQKDSVVCTVSSSYSANSQNKDAKTLSDITVRCGVYNRIIGGDKDAGGCLVGAGYSWCEPKQKCLRVWEEECK